MNGLAFLAKLMKHYPLPVVVVSSLTPKNSETAMRALELGAVEVICKPGSAYSASEISHQLIQAVRAAASARIAQPQGTLETPAKVSDTTDFHLQTTHKVLAIGASTGGTRAIETVLRSLPPNSPGTLIVQHMPEQFTTAFAQRLNQICQMEVREARDNDAVLPGVALVAPGNRHMLLQQSGARYLARIKNGPAVNHQRPSADVLFQSVARSAGNNAIGALLTGMGSDGQRGFWPCMKKELIRWPRMSKHASSLACPKRPSSLGLSMMFSLFSKFPGPLLIFFKSKEKKMKIEFFEQREVSPHRSHRKPKEGGRWIN